MNGQCHSPHNSCAANELTAIVKHFSENGVTVHISEAKELIAASLDNDQIEFDSNGICKLDTDQGVAMIFVFASPVLRVCCPPLSAADYRQIEDRVTLLESLLAINYESDIGSRQAFKMGFHREHGFPVVTTEMSVGKLQAETLRANCDELKTIASVVRKAIMGDSFTEEDVGASDSPEHEPSAFDDNSLWL